jgi:hypothetical protein
VPPAGEKRIAFVVGDAANLANGEQDVLFFAQDLGYIVDVVDDADNSRDFRDDGLVVISSSANANQLQDKWDTNQPVLVLSSGVFSQMRLTAVGNAAAGQQNAKVIDIVTAGHPLASGLSGKVTLSDANTQLNFGAPGPEATVIAAINADPKKAVIFAYDVGAALVAKAGEGVRMARNRRVGFFLRQNDFANLRTDGQLLLETALKWTWAGGTGL